ncbi:hypothetical protein TNCV_3255731 [Trichonephila clavipes]|nr:hypothetical protein TNCV_3255731 [Trichonephila clavipes]
MRCHAEDISLHSARTEAVYDEWIPLNDVFEKRVASAICASAWRRSFRMHPDTNATFSAFREVEDRPTHLLRKPIPSNCLREKTRFRLVLKSGPDCEEIYKRKGPMSEMTTKKILDYYLLAGKARKA